MQLVIVVATLLLIILNTLVALKAFNDGLFYRKCILHTDGILISKQYARLISAGFVHQSWAHLFFHMFVLMSFALAFKAEIMLHSFLLAYVGGLLGGNLLALYTHRHDACFQSSGAAGAISGLVFGTTLIFPEQTMQLFFFPIHLPAWVFGFAILLYSLYGLKSTDGRRMYEEHLGGIIAGGGFTFLLHPHILQNYPFLVFGFVVASIFFLWMLSRHQAFVPIILKETPIKEEPVVIQIRTTKESGKSYQNKEAELNYLLDEVARIGFKQLSITQKRRLEELSQDPELF